ncbi:GNAT family N-acetyltransferase [Pontibacter sp. G13]|uniref:GNAT family N-acetyltransferase n=1 Tax=Pontibacter sp. G13 TaxID=3074898 RepID=UPI00288B6A05|nr:GNAT family N-acetyltransferase [Pontibacter sp. G13]WNJ17615.1 GNAT family N-acetyltransferase [Pontibacter sp. G13]
MQASDRIPFHVRPAHHSNQWLIEFGTFPDPSAGFMQILEVLEANGAEVLHRRKLLGESLIQFHTPHGRILLTLDAWDKIFLMADEPQAQLQPIVAWLESQAGWRRADATVHIRKAAASDREVLVSMAQTIILSQFEEFLGAEAVKNHIERGAAAKEIDEHLHQCDVLMLGGDLVGFAVYFDDLLHLMMIAPGHQRQGLGQQLLTHVETRLFTKHPRIRLETFEGNDIALNFFQSAGWSAQSKQSDPETGIPRIHLEKVRPQSQN